MGNEANRQRNLTFFIKNNLVFKEMAVGRWQMADLGRDFVLKVGHRPSAILIPKSSFAYLAPGGQCSRK